MKAIPKLCLIFTAILPTHAAIMVPNSSFEDPVTTTSDYGATGWVEHIYSEHPYNAGGVMNSDQLDPAISGITGSQVSYFSGGALWTADDVTVITAGTTYTLTVDVAGALYNYGALNYVGFSISLFDGTITDEAALAQAWVGQGAQPVDNILATTGKVITREDTQMTSYSISFTPDETHPSIGHGLKIMLAGTVENDYYMDNVRLTATVVPEPSSLALMGALAVPSLMRRRRGN